MHCHMAEGKGAGDLLGVVDLLEGPKHPAPKGGSRCQRPAPSFHPAPPTSDANHGPRTPKSAKGALHHQHTQLHRRSAPSSVLRRATKAKDVHHLLIMKSESGSSPKVPESAEVAGIGAVDDQIDGQLFLLPGSQSSFLSE